MGVEEEGEPVSTPRSLPFWPLLQRGTAFEYPQRSGGDGGGAQGVTGARTGIHCVSPPASVLTDVSPPNSQPSFLK